MTLPAISQQQLSKLAQWVQKVLWESKLPRFGEEPNHDSPDFSIHRLKGRIILDSGLVKMIQGVRDVYEITDVLEKDGEDGTTGKVVVIGKHILDLPWRQSLHGYLQLVD